MTVSDRDWDTPEYRKWRTDVYRRDRYKCLKCGSKRKLQAHHIMRWADHPLLRFDLNNGITLCRRCHGQMWGREDDYVYLCRQLLDKKKSVEVMYLLWKMRNLEENNKNG